MRKQIVLMLLIASVAFVCFLSPVYAEEAVPVAVVEEPSFEFGAVYEGVDVIHDFIIQNKGDADLEITGVKTG